MNRGIKRIFFGCALILMQLLIIFGGLKNGADFKQSFYKFILFGIIGFVFLIWGLIANRKFKKLRAEKNYIHERITEAQNADKSVGDAFTIAPPGASQADKADFSAPNFASASYPSFSMCEGMSQQPATKKSNRGTTRAVEEKSKQSTGNNYAHTIPVSLPDASYGEHGTVCNVCGSSVGDGSRFCSKCGALMPQKVQENLNVSQVQFSAVVPQKIVKNEYSMIELVVYEEAYRHIVERVMENANDMVREVVGGCRDIADNTLITVKLSSPDIELSDCEETQKWEGKYLNFSFPFMVSGSYAKKQILFIASVYFNDLIATRLKFIVDCTSLKEQKINLTRDDVLSAFISYASQDRGQVATIIQGMKKARPDMDIFFDVDNLRSGDDWETALRGEIEARDVLFLCWSSFAKASEWVEKEWRYALANKGLDYIEPIPLISPKECPPPDELKSKHFNDRTLLYKDL